MLANIRNSCPTESGLFFHSRSFFFSAVIVVTYNTTNLRQPNVEVEFQSNLSSNNESQYKSIWLLVLINDTLGDKNSGSKTLFLKAKTR